MAVILVEADYHMKLIGMGLADGVDGVESYLKSIHLRPGESPPPMSVLRWWFTLKYDSIAHSEAGDAFELIGQGVRVLSENEMLAEQGQRVHTGASDPLNRQFAEAFTSPFCGIGEKISRLWRVAKYFRSCDGVRDHSNGWTCGARRLEVDVACKPRQVTFAAPADPPREVETVINHRVINQRYVIAGVSGGVMVAPGDVLRGERHR